MEDWWTHVFEAILQGLARYLGAHHICGWSAAHGTVCTDFVHSVHEAGSQHGLLSTLTLTMNMTITPVSPLVSQARRTFVVGHEPDMVPPAAALPGRRVRRLDPALGLQHHVGGVHDPRTCHRILIRPRLRCLQPTMTGQGWGLLQLGHRESMVRRHGLEDVRTEDAVPPGAVGPTVDRPHEHVDVHGNVQEVSLRDVQRPVLVLQHDDAHVFRHCIPAHRNRYYMNWAMITFHELTGCWLLSTGTSACRRQSWDWIAAYEAWQRHKCFLSTGAGARSNPQNHSSPPGASSRGRRSRRRTRWRAPLCDCPQRRSCRNPDGSPHDTARSQRRTVTCCTDLYAAGVAPFSLSSRGLHS